MTISPQSPVNSVQPQSIQNNSLASKRDAPKADSVQLSTAAAAHLKSGDQDHDGDTH